VKGPDKVAEGVKAEAEAEAEASEAVYRESPPSERGNSTLSAVVLVFEVFVSDTARSQVKVPGRVDLLRLILVGWVLSADPLGLLLKVGRVQPAERRSR
jgi:hypothetical protein